MIKFCAYPILNGYPAKHFLYELHHEKMDPGKSTLSKYYYKLCISISQGSSFPHEQQMMNRYFKQTAKALIRLCTGTG